MSRLLVDCGSPSANKGNLQSGKGKNDAVNEKRNYIALKSNAGYTHYRSGAPPLDT